MFVFSEGTCGSCYNSHKEGILPFLLWLHTPENEARGAGWKKGGDIGRTMSEVGEKLTAFSVLKPREEIELSASGVLKNWCIKLLFQEQRL